MGAFNNRICLKFREKFLESIYCDTGNPFLAR